MTQIDTEDTLPISKLAESDKTQSAAEKRPAEAQPSDSTRLKRSRSSSTTTSGSLNRDSPWAPPITVDDKPIRAGDSANNIEVSVALSTALLLPENLNRNAQMSEYENFSLMLQHSVQVSSIWYFSFFFFCTLKEFSNNFCFVHFSSGYPARPLLLNAIF